MGSLGNGSAEAHKRNFVWSYEWFTPLPAEKEVETWLTFIEKGSKWESWLEYEFAPGERWGVGLYLVFEHSPQRNFDWRGWKWENRYRFGTFDFDRWLHAGYLELKKKEGEPYKVEAKWLLSRYTHRDEAFVLNLIAEKPLASGEVEWELTLGWNRPVAPRLRLGLEALGKFEDRVYFLGPNATYDFSPSSRLILNAGVGLTRRSGDVAVRAIWEYEWF
jgi:hypothetical protein